MRIKNQTSVEYFRILTFCDKTGCKVLISYLFFLIYFAGVLVNSSIITVISLEPQLHKPMFLFICNLSVIDILYTTVTVPKFLDVLLSGNNIVSFAQCFTQFYFHFAVASAEDILLFIMAYDRYVAICLPLHYHRIMSRGNCTLIIIGLWVTACFNSLLFIISVLNMTSCHSNTIHQFFCDIKSLTMITCTGTELLYIITVEILLYGLCPFLCTLVSYINIFSIVLRIKSSDGRRKAFSTCSSHLMIITMYYASAVIVYLLPVYSDVVDFVFTAFYTTVIPMLNPIIYSLQNSDVKVALRRLLPQSLNIQHSNNPTLTVLHPSLS